MSVSVFFRDKLLCAIVCSCQFSNRSSLWVSPSACPSSISADFSCTCSCKPSKLTRFGFVLTILNSVSVNNSVNSDTKLVNESTTYACGFCHWLWFDFLSIFAGNGIFSRASVGNLKGIGGRALPHSISARIIFLMSSSVGEDLPTRIIFGEVLCFDPDALKICLNPR